MDDLHPKPWMVIGGLRRFFRFLAWFVVGLLLGACLLHLLGASRWYWEIAVASVTPWILLPAWPVAIAAGLRRHWMLVAGAGVVIVCQVVWVGPQFKPWNSAPPPASSLRLRLFDANISQTNLNLTGIGAEIEAARPDVVVLEELTPHALVSLQTSGAVSAFPYHVLRAKIGAGGMGLWSVSRLSAITTWDNGGGQVELEATVPFAGRKIRVAGAHVYAPTGDHEPTLWHSQLARLASHLRSQPRPLLVAGDFNSTTDVPQFRKILNEGLSDAAVVTGQGWRMTWPRNQAWVLPYLRIDHVLLSAQLTVTSYRLGTGKGSDHRPLVVDVALAR